MLVAAIIGGWTVLAYLIGWALCAAAHHGDQTTITDDDEIDDKLT